MFAHFVCALLGFLYSFCARKFPTKSGKTPGHLALTKGCITINIHTEHGRILSERAPQESEALWDRRTFTPCNLPVLHAPAGHEVCSGTAYPFRAANHSCTSGSLSEDCCNKGRTQTPPPGGRPQASTVLRLTTKVNRNI